MPPPGRARLPGAFGPEAALRARRLCQPAAPTSEGAAAAAAQGRSIELHRQPSVVVIIATIKANRNPLGC